MFGVELVIKALEALESKVLHINPMQCSRCRHQLSKCQLCADHCPTMAINWDESLNVNVDKCTGCGICANICPNGVFEADNPSNDALLSLAAASLKGFDQIAFTCLKCQQKTGHSGIQAANLLLVPCLGRIDDSLLVYCVSLGAKSVLLVDGLCQNCQYREGWEIARQTVTTANRILSIFGIPERILFSADAPGRGVKEGNTALCPPANLCSEQYSRRDFFKTITQGTKKAVIRTTSSIVKIGTDDNKADIRKSGLPFCLPRKRQLLLESIKKLGEPEKLGKPGPLINAEDLPFCQLKFNDNCTGCGMCAYFCPTGALKAEKESRITITFQLSHCTRCNLCREVCYKGAISTSLDLQTEKIINNAMDILFVADADSS